MSDYTNIIDVNEQCSGYFVSIQKVCIYIYIYIYTTAGGISSPKTVNGMGRVIYRVLITLQLMSIRHFSILMVIRVYFICKY